MPAPWRVCAHPCEPQSFDLSHPWCGLLSWLTDVGLWLLVCARSSAPGSGVNCAMRRSDPRASKRHLPHESASLTVFAGGDFGPYDNRDWPAFEFAQTLYLRQVAVTSRRHGELWTIRSRSPVLSIVRRVFLHGCDPSLPERTLPPACWVICPRVHPHVLAEWFPDPACNPP